MVVVLASWPAVFCGMLWHSWGPYLHHEGLIRIHGGHIHLPRRPYPHPMRALSTSHEGDPIHIPRKPYPHPTRALSSPHEGPIHMKALFARGPIHIHQDPIHIPWAYPHPARALSASHEGPLSLREGPIHTKALLAWGSYPKSNEGSIHIHEDPMSLSTSHEGPIRTPWWHTSLLWGSCPPHFPAADGAKNPVLLKRWWSCINIQNTLDIYEICKCKPNTNHHLYLLYQFLESTHWITIAMSKKKACANETIFL